MARLFMPTVEKRKLLLNDPGLIKERLKKIASNIRARTGNPKKESFTLTLVQKIRMRKGRSCCM